MQRSLVRRATLCVETDMHGDRVLPENVAEGWQCLCVHAIMRCSHTWPHVVGRFLLSRYADQRCVIFFNGTHGTRTAEKKITIKQVKWDRGRLFAQNKKKTFEESKRMENCLWLFPVKCECHHAFCCLVCLLFVGRNSPLRISLAHVGRQSFGVWWPHDARSTNTHQPNAQSNRCVKR